MNSTLLLILNIILIVVECSTLYLFTESFFKPSIMAFGCLSQYVF